MTPNQIELVQSTWSLVLPIRDKAAAMFYGKLFELDPTLAKLFKSDTKAQGTKLMEMIGIAVNGLSRLETIVPAVQQLGKRHAGYGVKDSDYATVATALLWTLEEGLGPAFTGGVKQAWTEAYILLASTMQQAAKSVAA